MAKATVKKKVVETVEGVTLELSKREAEFLLFVFGNIAGQAFWQEDPGAKHGTGPGSAIYGALLDAGVEASSDIEQVDGHYFDFLRR